MIDQESMFGDEPITEEPPRARKKDPGTSHEAAGRVVEFAGNHYEKILAVMASTGTPMGAEQISAALLRGRVKLDAYQVRKRLPELERRGSVKLTKLLGMGTIRGTSSGRHERLWELAK